MTNSTHDDLFELAAAYALDAVDDVERARFERHLSGCDECQEEVRTVREITAGFAILASEDPPPAVRDAVLEIPRSTPQASEGGAGGTALPAADPPRPKRVWLALAAAGGFALAAVGGAAWLQADQRADDLAAQLEILDAPDAATIELAGPAGVLRLTASASEGAALVRADDLGEVGAEWTYQLWRLTDAADGPVSLGLLGNDSSVHVRIPLDPLAPADVLAVTIEPVGGSPAPTSDPILVSDPLT